MLETGQLVGIPTETVYGLAANALDEQAVTRIFEAKNRPTFDPLIVHTNSLEKIRAFTTDLPEVVYRLAERFWPGPLTLLLPRTPLIPDLVTAGLDRVAVRIPDHPMTLALLADLDFPLAAPSANPFGYISPTTAGHVQQQLGSQIAYILDGGPAKVGIESTIVGFEEGKTIVYRLGGVSVEAIEQITGPVEVRAHSTSNPKAPGMLKSHYAPTKPFFVEDTIRIPPGYPPDQVGILAFQESLPGIPPENQRVLSATGDFLEAARNLFVAMRELDALPLSIIVAQLLPEQNLGRAINDRLRRAGAKKTPQD